MAAKNPVSAYSRPACQATAASNPAIGASSSRRSSRSSPRCRSNAMTTATKTTPAATHTSTEGSATWYQPNEPQKRSTIQRAKVEAHSTMSGSKPARASRPNEDGWMVP